MHEIENLSIIELGSGEFYFLKLEISSFNLDKEQRLEGGGGDARCVSFISHITSLISQFLKTYKK